MRPETAHHQSKNRVLSATIVSCLMLLIPACRIPKLQPPQQSAALPQSFFGEFDPQNSSQVPLDEFFNDPALTSLIDQSLVSNQQLRILAQDIQIANNQIMKRRGAFLPFVGFGAGAGVTKASEFTPLGAAESQLTYPGANGANFARPLPNFLVGLNVSWEIDIWRKLRNARDAAALRYLGTADGRNYVVTRLVAEIAENYYTLLALDKRLEMLDKTIALQEQSRDFAKARKEAARGTELAVQRFQADVSKNQSEKLIIKQEIVQVENRINFLAGRFPQPVERGPVEFLDLNLRALSIGVPSQLLQYRPDIRQAERELAASGLDVRSARARFYPSLFITSGVGIEAFNTKYILTTPESLIYSVASDLVAPVLNRAAIRADYLSANAEQLQALYEYQRTILTAFTEVINLTNKVANYNQSIELKKQQLLSLDASVESATRLFQNARVEYVEVLLVQRDLLQARIDLIEAKRQQLSAIVNTYQALGGGLLRAAPGTWVPPEVVPENSPTKPLEAPPAEPVLRPAPEPVEKALQDPVIKPAPERVDQP